MKVILLQDIQKVGRKLEIKNVSEGFARNFLIPKGLVKIANKTNINWLHSQKERLAQEKEKVIQETKALVSQLNDKRITIKEKVGEKKQLFESITKHKIAERLKELGFNIKKEQIELREPIKKIGKFPIKINFDNDLTATIKLTVSAQKK